MGSNISRVAEHPGPATAQSGSRRLTAADEGVNDPRTTKGPPSRVAVSPGSAPRKGQFPVREHGWYRSRSIVRVVHVRKRLRMPIEGAEPCLNRWRRRAVSISWQNSRFPPK